jgi:hypothetical protein
MAQAQRATTIDSRELMRELRTLVAYPGDQPRMPESALWSIYCEMKRRGMEDADRRFLTGVRTLHRRRSNGGLVIPVEDPAPRQHLEADDPFLGELWKAYKRCIQRTRMGAALQLYRDMEAQLEVH